MITCRFNCCYFVSLINLCESSATLLRWNKIREVFRIQFIFLTSISFLFLFLNFALLIPCPQVMFCTFLGVKSLSQAKFTGKTLAQGKYIFTEHTVFA